jgi:replication factor C subunit 2/4
MSVKIKSFSKNSSISKIPLNDILPWVEKYRPKTVDEICYQEEVVNALKKSLETKNLPHLLFYGPPGTGKTSTILALGRQLYGPDIFKQRVLELNASDERGINVIRTKVKTFSQYTVSSNINSKYPCPPYKLVILDEADSMTSDAQAALRRTMETYSKTTRFCLICNYVSRIIEPLTSRCAKFRFKSLTFESMMDRIRYICEKEGIIFTEELGKTLVETSEGDLRKAITYLQSAFLLYGKETKPQSIIEIAGKISSIIISNLIKTLTSNSFEKLQETTNDIILSGYPASQIISQLFDYVIESKELKDSQKANIVEQLAQTDKCLQDGADEFLQLISIFSFFMKEFCVSY